MNELKKMREIRIAQVGLRKTLKECEENNKSIRAKITPIWDDKSKDDEVKVLTSELVKGRCAVRATQYALRELKHGIRLYNKVYDRKQKKVAAKTES